MNILYEDNHIIVAVKPQNMPSQADCSGDLDFLSAVREYVRVAYQKPGAAYLGLVHRLDRPAGGVMVFARTSKAAARLARQLQNGTFQKTYYAVVDAKTEKSAVLTHYLVKDSAQNISCVAPKETPGAKYAELSYEAVAHADPYALLRIRLMTGRPHQIRVQLSHIGAPLVGDCKYGGASAPNLCLWSYAVRIEHPTQKTRMTFSCPPPNTFPWNLFPFEASPNR